MRRLLPPMLVVAALLAAPAAHAADDVYFDITEGSRGSVRSTTAQPTELRLERGGGIIRTDGPGTENEINVTPRPGDVARVILNGIETGAAPFDGRPTLDDTCSRVGTTTVSGSWQPGDRGGAIGGLLGRGEEVVTGTGSADAGSYTVTFPRAIERDDTVVIESTEARSQPGGSILGVNVTRTKRVCPFVPPARAIVSGKGTHPARRVGRDRRFSLPRIAIRCPGAGPGCSVTGNVTSPKLGNLARIDFDVPANGRRIVRARLFRFAVPRLKRVGKARVKVQLFTGRNGVATVNKTVRLTLRAPKAKRKR